MKSMLSCLRVLVLVLQVYWLCSDDANAFCTTTRNITPRRTAEIRPAWHADRFLSSLKRCGGTITAFTTSALHLTSIPCNEGTLVVTRSDQEYNIGYRLFRPMSLSSRQAAPVVVLHGGPSVPSDYLQPLVDLIHYRSMLFYDQLGCGVSDEPTDTTAYSIDWAVRDLEALLKTLSVRRFHLYGQSFGGILAYEYLKQNVENRDYECLSVVLSSAPWNVTQVEQEANRLIQYLESPELFRETHQCQTREMPEPLVTAYVKAGTVWRGTTAIADYQAVPLSDDEKSLLPSCMVLRGQHDFVTDPCVEGWRNMFGRRIRYHTLVGCSHHGLLENPALYGETLESFFAEYD
mmetsp:Transcript_893/g.1758  ORF Transcript_893/g.1758 Transcript_893/m.1758 type:complete len:348 (+) Transcript_893:2-1045(+)